MMTAGAEHITARWAWNMALLAAGAFALFLLIRGQTRFGPNVLYLGEKNEVIRFEGPITYSPSAVALLPPNESADNSGTTTSNHTQSSAFLSR